MDWNIVISKTHHLIGFQFVTSLVDLTGESNYDYLKTSKSNEWKALKLVWILKTFNFFECPQSSADEFTRNIRMHCTHKFFRATNFLYNLMMFAKFFLPMTIWMNLLVHCAAFFVS